MSQPGDTIRIHLAAVPATDAFGLRIALGGTAASMILRADAPGVLRGLDVPPAPDMLLRKGWILGFLQRGPLRMPVLMPCDGWVLAAAADGARVGHGTALFCILRALEGISP